jgi:HlyD family secretion protein
VKLSKQSNQSSSSQHATHCQRVRIGRAFPLKARTSAGVLLALSALGIAGCQKGGDAPPKVAATQAAQQVATQVSVTKATVGPIQQVAVVTGALNSLNDVVVGVKLAGKIRDVYVREGDTVRAGQVVAQQDPADLQAQYDQQVANQAVAETKLDQAKVALKNAETTLKNAETTLTLTDAQTKSAVRQAAAALDIAKQEGQVIKVGARLQERQQAQENIASAKADRDKARADLKRYQTLYKQNAVAAQQLDQAQAAADSADARYNSMMQAYSLIQEGSRPEDIRRAQASVEQANQLLVTAQANRDQVVLRRADVDTAQAGIASAQAGIEQAKAGVEQAKAAVRLAKQGLNDAVIRSPIDGVVAERKVEPGMQLGAGKDVMRIVSLTNVFFDAQLPEVQFAQVNPGQVVEVTIDALGGRHFQGAVSKIYPVASTQARSFTARIQLKNEANLLRPQMFARGRIVLATHPRAILIPHDAVLDVNGDTGRVFVVTGDGKEQKARETKVKLGFATAQQYEITDGVKAGDTVVSVGQAQLQDNTPVQVIPAGPDQAPRSGS